MSYSRLNLEWVKFVVKLRQNYPCATVTSNSNVLSCHPTTNNLIPVSGRLFSTSLRPKLMPQVKSRKERVIKSIKSESTLAPQTSKSEDVKIRGLKKADREKVARLKFEEMERAKRELSLKKNLVAYLDMCVFVGDMHRATKSLLYYRAKKDTALDISAFNIVLHGYAATGNLTKVKEIFQLILDDKLPPNPQTYAAILECLARRIGGTNSTKNIKLTIQSLQSNGYTLNDLFNHCVYIKDQQIMVMNAICHIDPLFEPQITKPFKGYVCPLLENLNNVSRVPNYVSPSQGLISQSYLVSKAKKQLHNELEGRITVTSIEKKDKNDNMEHYRNVLSLTEEMWAGAIRSALQRNLQSLLTRNQQQALSPWAINLYPFLKLLTPEDYIKIITLEIRKLAEGSETYSPQVIQLHRQLGERVLARYQILHKKDAGIIDKLEKLFHSYISWHLRTDNDSALNPRQKWRELLHDPKDLGPNIDVSEKNWHNGVLVNIGRFLYDIIMEDIKIDVNVMKNSKTKTERLVPAFYSIYRMHGPHLKEELKPHPVLVKLWQAASRDELIFDTTLAPMVCPPLPWSSIRTGGYILSSAKIIRLPFQAHQQMSRLKNCQPENLYPALDSLNQLGAVPWKVNEDVLDILIQVFNNKGNESIGVPSPPSECKAPPAIDTNATREEVIAIYKSRQAYRQRKGEMYSLWCDCLYKLSLANHFRKDVFWFPHNMDFRGRVYPCPPHLNHLGADTSRAILVFAKGEPLGPTGLDWLKIHMINLTGLKKRDSIAERLRYANEIMDDILDSAEKPLTGRGWWKESDEPWQTLACCIEISKALKSGDPESFISHFPVHQDGSCNGLQHYAALGRDQIGAESVNLSPSDIPQDVYSAVANLVEKQRVLDAETGLEVAKVLEGFIKRKVIKQTVMTTVYGVTRFGARLQISKQLKELPNFPKHQVWPASLYLVGKTFDSLQEMFTSTKEIQDWFTECARLISQVCGQNVEWVTPLGLPVVQPYIKISPKSGDTHNLLKIPNVTTYDTYERPNVMKQKNAFPPNFIHSLDSSHMMLTSLYAERTGITFVSVHDCYWTHPKTVTIMNHICREQFVALHSQPILQDLSKYFQEKFSYSGSELLHDDSATDIARTKLNDMLTEVPPTGSFNLQKVLESVYFFS